MATELLIVFGARRGQVPAGIRELLVDVGHLPADFVGDAATDSNGAQFSRVRDRSRMSLNAF